MTWKTIVPFYAINMNICRVEPPLHSKQPSGKSPREPLLITKSTTPEHISIKSQCLVIPAVIQGLLIAQYEHKLDHLDIQGTLPIGVIRCAAAKASPIENLPWVTYLPCGCLKKANWYNVHAQCCELIKARGIRSHRLHNRCPLVCKMSSSEILSSVYQ